MKQVRDQIVWKYVEDIAQGLKIQFICYPYSDCHQYIVNYKPDVVRIGITNPLQFISIL